MCLCDNVSLCVCGKLIEFMSLMSPQCQLQFVNLSSLYLFLSNRISTRQKANKNNEISR